MNQRRRLGFEGLERRELLAGNVNAGLNVNGELVITGDFADNHVAIYRGSFGQLLVEGGRATSEANSATRVNGQLGAAAFNTTGGVILNMGDGNDRVLLTNVPLQGNVRGDLGGGNDQLALESSSLGAIQFTMNDGRSPNYAKFGMSGLVNVEGGRGNDIFSLYDATIGGNLSVFGQSGRDTFVQSGSSHSQNGIGGSFYFNGGGNDDTTTVRRMAVSGEFSLVDTSALNRSTVGLTNLRVSLDLRVTLSPLPDTLIIQGEDTSTNRFQARNLYVNTGAGNDFVNINQGIMNRLRVDTESGSELGSAFGVELFSLTVGTQVIVLTGDGTDRIRLRNISADELRVDSGASDDLITIQNVNASLAVIETFGGDDIVNLSNSDFDVLIVRLGDGNDTLAAQGLTVTDHAVFDGGIGFNTYQNNGGNSYNRLARKNI